MSVVEPPNDLLLEVDGLQMHYPVPRGIVGTLRGAAQRVIRAVDGVELTLARGEVLALVGESGCGKTTTALSVLGLIAPTAGEVRFEGRPLHAELRKDRGLRRAIQMIFQDPYESLNPRISIGRQVIEPLEVHGIGTPQERVERAYAALEEVGLRPAGDFFARMPHELSGGQRQRVAIAAALVTEPRLLVADEPVSMLDVSIRAEILTLLNDLRRRRGISILFITHDLATAALFADRIAVMYLGRVVEIGPANEVLEAPQHPYTRALRSVVPSLQPGSRRERIVLRGETPNPADVPPGCRFHPRCPIAVDACKHEDPALERRTGRMVACIRVG